MIWQRIRIRTGLRTGVIMQPDANPLPAQQVSARGPPTIGHGPPGPPPDRSGQLAKRSPPGARVQRRPTLSEDLRRITQEHGVLLRPRGDTLYELPPAWTSEQEVDQIAAALRAMVKIND
jgi:hypothetical protein